MTCPSAVPGTHWNIITKDVVNEIIPVTKYESKKTGIKVIISDVEGPLVNGYFALGDPQVRIGLATFL